MFALAAQLTVPFKPRPERASFTGTEPVHVTPDHTLALLEPVHGLVPVQVARAVLPPATSSPNCARPAVAHTCGSQASHATRQRPSRGRTCARRGIGTGLCCFPRLPPVAGPKGRLGIGHTSHSSEKTKDNQQDSVLGGSWRGGGYRALQHIRAPAAELQVVLPCSNDGLTELIHPGT